jgi:hypothetical protein
LLARGAGNIKQACELAQCLDADEGGADRKTHARGTIGHPHGNRSGALVALAQPELVIAPYTASNENRVPM